MINSPEGATVNASFANSTVVVGTLSEAEKQRRVLREQAAHMAGEVLPVQYSLLQPGHAWVRIYTLQGDFVATLFEEDVSAASVEQPYLSQKKDWDGRNADGQIVASGVYIVHLEAPGFRANARVAVIK